jgi:hypothetical protein
MTNDPVLNKTAMTDQAFSDPGGGKIAYVKPIRSEDVHDCIRRRLNCSRVCDCSRFMPRMARPSSSPIRAKAAIANAWSNELEP